MKQSGEGTRTEVEGREEIQFLEGMADFKEAEGSDSREVHRERTEPWIIISCADI